MVENVTVAHLTDLLNVVAGWDQDGQAACLQLQTGEIPGLTQRTSIVDGAFTSEVSFEGTTVKVISEEARVGCCSPRSELLDHGGEDGLSLSCFVVVHLTR